MATLARARAAKVLLRDEMAGADGVSGVGLSRVPRDAADASEGTAVSDDTAASNGTDDWRLRVNVVTSEVPVPRSVAGVDVEVRVVGTVTPT